MHYINRRENPRVEVSLKCRVATPGPWAQTSIQTENISRNGLLLRWGSAAGELPLPEPGAMLTIDIELPTHHGFGRKCIRCHTSVERITTGNSAPLVAFTVNYMKFGDYFDTQSLSNPLVLSSRQFEEWTT
jgi:hypothetical protein